MEAKKWKSCHKDKMAVHHVLMISSNYQCLLNTQGTASISLATEQAPNTPKKVGLLDCSRMELSWSYISLSIEVM